MAAACPGCGHQQARSVSAPSPSGYRYLICPGCGLGRIDPLPGADGAGPPENYDQGYFVDGAARAGYPDYLADERWHRRTARTRLQRVAAALEATTPGGRQPPAAAPVLVDVGTAVGYLPDEARRLGWHAVGVEVSGWAAGQARARGLRVESDLDGVADLAGRVDVVTLFQVLEHLPDPPACLAQVARLLRPGGVVVCETWDVQSRTARWSGQHWQQLSPPSVLWLFSAASAAAMVGSAGLRPVSWRRTGKVVGAATVLEQAVPGPGPAARLVRRLRPWATRVPVPYLLDDLVTFVASKPTPG